jgi:hypothetical protein
VKASDVHLIGHSLGSHIAGYAGEKILNLGRISGSFFISFNFELSFCLTCSKIGSVKVWILPVHLFAVCLLLFVWIHLTLSLLKPFTLMVVY